MHPTNLYHAERVANEVSHPWGVDGFLLPNPPSP